MAGSESCERPSSSRCKSSRANRGIDCSTLSCQLWCATCQTSAESHIERSGNTVVEELWSSIDTHSRNEGIGGHKLENVRERACAIEGAGAVALRCRVKAVVVRKKNSGRSRGRDEAAEGHPGQSASLRCRLSTDNGGGEPGRTQLTLKNATDTNRR
jgi:hypothetical protein